MIHTAFFPARYEQLFLCGSALLVCITPVFSRHFEETQPSGAADSKYLGSVSTLISTHLGT